MTKIKEIKIEIEISPDLDVLGFNILRNEIKEGHELYSQFKNKVDKFSGDNLEEKIQEFLDREDTKNKLGKIGKKWQETKDRFLALSAEVFENKANKYIDHLRAYPTVWDVVIQNPEEKAVSFSIDENVDKSIYEIIHEVMHVLFLTYLMYENSDYFKELEESNRLWKIQEVFNGVLLNTEKYRELYSNFTSTNYEVISDEINKLADGLGDNFTVSDFIENYKRL